MKCKDYTEIDNIPGCRMGHQPAGFSRCDSSVGKEERFACFQYPVRAKNEAGQPPEEEGSGDKEIPNCIHFTADEIRCKLGEIKGNWCRTGESRGFTCPEFRGIKEARIELEETQDLICEICDEMKEFLLSKNEAYGNSITSPINIFSKATPLEGVRIRIDDKLKRLMEGRQFGNEDTKKDLIGYLIFERIIERAIKEKS